MRNVKEVIEKSPKTAVPEWEEAVDAILEINEKDKPTVHQDVIVSHFIAPLANEDLSIKDRSQIVTNNWIGVAGHVSRAIKVADSNGNIVATLPPLISPIDTHTVFEERNTLSHISQEAEKQAMLAPARGHAFMIEKISEQGFKSTTLLKSMLEWNNLAEKLNAPIPFKEIYNVTRNVVKEPDKREYQLTTNPDNDELI